MSKEKATNVNVGQILAPTNDFNDITHNFVKQKNPDKQAAMERRIATEHLMDEWGYRINNSNTREMPLHLLRLYEEAYNTIEKILNIELQIILGRK